MPDLSNVSGRAEGFHSSHARQPLDYFNGFKEKITESILKINCLLGDFY